MKISELLISAKALIDTPEKWIQNTEAMTAYKEQVDCTHSLATCFCSLGAIGRVEYTNKLEHNQDARDHLSHAMTGDYWRIGNYNDSHTHSEVMAMWDKAIQLAKERGI